MRIPSRVYQSTDAAVRPERLTGHEHQGAAPTASRRGPDADVKVTVSAEARARAAESALDSGKIARLRAALGRGELAVNALAIANRMLETGG